jgi:hypothetical protein
MCNIAKAAATALRPGRAKEAAATILTDASKFEDTWQFGNSVHSANIALGHVALDAGDIDEAARCLIAAGMTRGSPQLDSFGPDRRLAKRLADAGARTAVIDYLTHCKSFWSRDRGATDRWIRRLTAGQPCSVDDDED